MGLSMDGPAAYLLGVRPIYIKGPRVALTRSEEVVAHLCRKSFLTPWSESNPIVRPGKELCDLLVVCAPDVVIFSVKEIELKDTGDRKTAWTRWHKRAVEGSSKQIYGAERWIRSASRVIRADGSPGLLLPPPSELVVHRVAVALGGRGSVPYQQGDFGKGFVHVLDDTSLFIVLEELDTITDFVDYLRAKEKLLLRGTVPIMQGQEEDLLALYLHRGRRFPTKPDLIVIGDDLWSGITAKPEWRSRKEADRESYVWDRLIETLYELAEARTESPEDASDSLEAALRVMARENRFNRRLLAKGFNEFMRAAAEERVRSRIVPSASNVRYVFLAGARDEDREMRSKELALRCLVARGLKEFSGDTVVGLATERYSKNAGFSLDAVYLKMKDWGPEQQAAMDGIQRDLSYFTQPLRGRLKDDEYPGTRQQMANIGRNAPCPCGSGKKYKRCHGLNRS